MCFNVSSSYNPIFSKELYMKFLLGVMLLAITNITFASDIVKLETKPSLVLASPMDDSGTPPGLSQGGDDTPPPGLSQGGDDTLPPGLSQGGDDTLPPGMAQAIPEPSTFILLIVAMLGFKIFRRLQ
jgi:hypothetical protein